MIVKAYSDIEPIKINNDQASNLAARVVLGKADGAENFCMRVFEMSEGGHTPKHDHDWEHEMFIFSGQGAVFGNGEWTDVKAGNVVFIPANETHQLKNSGKDPLVVVCMIPAGPPEL